MRNSLIPHSGSEWNRKVPNATLSGVECHSSSGAKHRRRSTPGLRVGSRLHLPHRTAYSYAHNRARYRPDHRCPIQRRQRRIDLPDLSMRFVGFSRRIHRGLCLSNSTRKGGSVPENSSRRVSTVKMFGRCQSLTHFSRDPCWESKVVLLTDLASIGA